MHLLLLNILMTQTHKKRHKNTKATGHRGCECVCVCVNTLRVNHKRVHFFSLVFFGFFGGFFVGFFLSPYLHLHYMSQPVGVYMCKHT